MQNLNDIFLLRMRENYFLYLKLHLFQVLAAQNYHQYVYLMNLDFITKINKYIYFSMLKNNMFTVYKTFNLIVNTTYKHIDYYDIQS